MSSNLLQSKNVIYLNVSGMVPHHVCCWHRINVVGSMLEHHLLLMARCHLKLGLTRELTIRLLVTRCAARFWHATPALACRRLKTGAVSGAGWWYVVINRWIWLSKRQDLTTGMLVVPVKHVGVGRPVHLVLVIHSSLTRGLLALRIKFSGGGACCWRWSSRNCDDCGSRVDGCGHEKLARSIHGVKVWKWSWKQNIKLLISIHHNPNS